MEIENMNGEQLLEVKEVNQTLGNDENMNAEPTKDSDGSLGKFENSLELKKAYDSLEKEFTKKCQKLKELEKQISDSDNAEKIAPETKKQEDEIDWKKEVEKLSSNNSFFKENINLIANEIKENPKLAEDKNGLLVALNNVMESSYKTQKELSVDEEFLNNFILNNPIVEDKIIEKYLNGVASQKNVRQINSQNGMTGLMPKSHPNSLTEAGKVAKEILNY